MHVFCRLIFLPPRARYLRATVCCLTILGWDVFKFDFFLFSLCGGVSFPVTVVQLRFLAYTSAVFAMLGLRATFFIIDMLVQLFSLLKYGVASVLVFIGIKLMISKVYHIPPMIVCTILFGTLALSMVDIEGEERNKRQI